ncbi:MAG: ABC transporter permease subunit [Anaerolineae bacterium]
MNWNWRGIRAIMRKDLKQVFQNTMVWIPFIIVPLVLMVLLPLGLVLLPTISIDELKADDLAGLFSSMPAELKARLASLSLAQSWVVLSANYMFMPMFLVTPLMVSSIIAADGIAGEKERKTLEGLLYTPLSDNELFLAKVLTALVPALVVEIGAFIVYAITVNLGGYHVMQRLFFPEPSWWPLVIFVGPGVSLAGLGATVLVSSKAKTFMSAQQAGGLLVLPVVFLMIGQLAGLFFLTPGAVWAVGLVFWAIGALFIWLGAKTFTRGELIARV